jgi:uncharacterized protein
MADTPAQTSKPSAAATLSDDDPGLQDFLRHVYNTMCLGLVITGSVSFLVSHIAGVANFLFSFPMFLVTLSGPVIFAFFGFTPQRISTMPAEKVSFIFAAYSAAMGLSISCVFWFVSLDVTSRMFFVTAAAFAATSYYGLTLKRNVGGTMSFVVMAASGLFFTFAANFLLHATKSYYIVSAVGMLAFSGIAVWETHVLKENYATYRGAKGAKDRLAIAGALVFYLTFVGVFQYILNFGFAQAGRRR